MGCFDSIISLSQKHLCFTFTYSKQFYTVLGNEHGETAASVVCHELSAVQWMGKGQDKSSCRWCCGDERSSSSWARAWNRAGLSQAAHWRARVFYTTITALLRCCVSLDTGQRKTRGSRTPSWVFFMVLLEKRERPVGLGLVSLKVFDWKYFYIFSVAAGNWFLSLLPRGIGFKIAGSSTVVEIRTQ